MKKYPRYGIRVSEGLDEALRRVGPERVREVLQEAFLGKKETGVPSWSKGKVEPAEEKAEPVAAVTETPRTMKMDMLRLIAAGRAKAPISAPVEVVAPPAMKTYQQMPPKVDYYAIGDPEPPEE